MPEGPCGLDEVERFQAVLPDYQVNVVTTNPNDLFLFRGPPREKKLHLFYHDNHFDVLTSLPGFLDTQYFCDICDKGYKTFEHHRCHKICQCCFNAKKEECQLSEWLHCADCDRSFKNPTCFANHKKAPNRSKVTIKAKTKTDPRTICQRIRRCTTCGTTVKDRHECGKRYCRNCESHQPYDHLCYMQTIKDKEGGEEVVDDEEILDLEDDDSMEEKKDALTYIFFDFECTQEDELDDGGYLHVPNYCVAHRVCLNCIENEDIHQDCDSCGKREHVFSGRNTQTDFCKWLLENKESTAIAHNMKGYDGHFILDYMNNIGLCPIVVMNGAKLMSIDLKEKARNKKKKDVMTLRIIDSCNFIPAPLSSFPKTFGLTEMKKGYFPYLFNTRVNENYVGPCPAVENYNPDQMKPAQRKAFLMSYEEQKNKIFNMTA